MNSFCIKRTLSVLLCAAALTASCLYRPPAVCAEPSYIIYNDEGQAAEDGKQRPRTYTGIWAKSSRTPSDLIHNERFADYDKIDCIDVSYHQGMIDWNVVASGGIRHAYIRIGFRGYGSGNIAADPRFVENFIGAKEAGIQVGVYFYSQAITADEAAEEARYVLNTLATFPQYTVDLPIYYDVEKAETNGDVGRVEAAGLTADDFTANCHSFCQTIRSGGYQAGIYTCRDWLEHQLNAPELETQYDIWLAHYTSQTSYTGKYNIWQYTASGQVSGISRPVDRNVIYLPRNGSSSAGSWLPGSNSWETLTPPSLSEVFGIDTPGESLTPPSLNEVFGIDMPGESLTPPSLNEVFGIDMPGESLTSPSLNVVFGIDMPGDPLTPPNLSEVFGMDMPGESLTPPSLSEVSGMDMPGESPTPPSLNEVFGIGMPGESLTPPSLSEVTGLETPGEFLTPPSLSEVIISGNLVCLIGTIRDCITMQSQQDAALTAPLLGDCNFDGDVNALDAVDILQFSSSSGSGDTDASVSSFQQTRFDFNGDGIINASDAADLLFITASMGAGS